MSGLREKVDTLPTTPGVYLMKNRAGEIFYIGKAKNLRARVRGYVSGSDTRAFVQRLEQIFHDLEVILTDSEKEALLLENELIKRHQPRFNVVLKDDKRYLCLRIDDRHRYPRVDVVRRFKKDGAHYFGPYHSASAIRETLRIVNRHFQLRTCSDRVLESRKRPCLQFQIQRCPAPCVEALADGVYGENVKNTMRFLDGKHEELVTVLRQRMKAHAAVLNFEAAGQVRDQLRAVERSLEKQRVVSPEHINRDAIGIYREGGAVEVHVLRTRQGKLIDAERFSFNDIEQLTADFVTDFLALYYDRKDRVPREILLPDDIEWVSVLEQVLSDRAGHAVSLHTPKRGEKLNQIRLARKNAEQAFVDQQRTTKAYDDAVAQLKRSLRLTVAPQSIECVDISHLQGEEIVASVVRLEQGQPAKGGYRHFKVKGLENQDDFRSMYEVVSRRAVRGLEDGDLPDLLVVDGGKGQLGAAMAALQDHGLDEQDVVSLAKARSKTQSDLKTTAQKPERVFLRNIKDPIVLKQDSAALFVLMRARDEAHRFAITYHRRRRAKRTKRSTLEDIPGVGPKTRAKLLKYFGSAQRVASSTKSALAGVVGEKQAKSIYEYLKRQKLT